MSGLPVKIKLSIRLRGQQRMPVDPKTTALLLIEYHNDFTTEGGALHAGVKSVMEKTNMLANSAVAATEARAAGATVMFAPISFAEGYREITPEPYGILRGIVDAHAFVRGSWGAQIVDSLSPRVEDIIVEGKRGLDTFASTNLDFILRSRGIRTLAVAGFLTNCCVESTARTGYERGFNIIALSDCAATLSDDEQRFTFEKNLPMFARIMTHAEFLSELAI
jgi:ureidoacrylate peracid hydrolase